MKEKDKRECWYCNGLGDPTKDFSKCKECMKRYVKQRLQNRKQTV